MGFIGTARFRALTNAADATSDDICAIGDNFPIEEGECSERGRRGRVKGREGMDGRRLTSDRTGRLFASQSRLAGHCRRILYKFCRSAPIL